MMANSSACASVASITDRKSTRLNSSHTEIYTLSLHDALPIYQRQIAGRLFDRIQISALHVFDDGEFERLRVGRLDHRSEEHTSELQSHRDLHSFPTRRSSDLSAPDSRPPLRSDSNQRAARFR